MPLLLLQLALSPSRLAIYCDDVNIPPMLLYFAGGPSTGNKIVQTMLKTRTSMLKDFSRDDVGDNSLIIFLVPSQIRITHEKMDSHPV